MLLIEPNRLEREYFARRPDVDDIDQLVSFGTSGHRGAPGKGTFTESHILAISQAICQHRTRVGITGPLFIGIDTHALSEPALASALEVFAANSIWEQRGWREALRRLRDQLESEEAASAPLAVAGGNAHATGIP